MPRASSASPYSRTASCDAASTTASGFVRRQRLQPDDERDAERVGERLAPGLRAAPGDGDDLHVAQRAVADVFQDQPRDDAAADDADAHDFPARHAFPFARILP